MSKKIRKSNLNCKVNGRITNPHSSQSNHLCFSFKHLDLDSFLPKKSADNYLNAFLERLKAISGFEINRFKTEKGKHLRAHKITWSETTKKNGFSHLNEQLQQCEPWQFQISANEHGRVHGFILNDIFYIVWLDPNHELYD